MRLLIRLRAHADAVYNEAYHHKLRGRIWRSLNGTRFEQLHDADHPTGLCFSNIFPPGSIDEGDQRTVLISSVKKDLLRAIASGVIEDRVFNIGEMSFRIEEVTSISPDVGEPGTHGVLESGTGLLIRIPPWRFDEYGIDAPSDEPEFWKPKHTLEPLRTQLENNLAQKHNDLLPEDLPSPSDVQGPLFSDVELIKTFAIPVTVTQGVERTFILSKFRFGYRIRDEHHRRHLNLALDAGLGERNALGLGFVNVTDKQLSGEAS